VLPANVVFLVDQIAGQPAIDSQIGKFGQVLLDQLGRAASLPAVFEVHLDQFDQGQSAQGRGLGRHEVGRGRRFATFLPGGHKCVDALRQLLPGNRNIVVSQADRLRHSVRPSSFCKADPGSADSIPTPIASRGRLGPSGCLSPVYRAVRRPGTGCWRLCLKRKKPRCSAADFAIEHRG